MLENSSCCVNSTISELSMYLSWLHSHPAEGQPLCSVRTFNPLDGISLSPGFSLLSYSSLCLDPHALYSPSSPSWSMRHRVGARGAKSADFGDRVWVSNPSYLNLILCFSLWSGEELHPPLSLRRIKWNWIFKLINAQEIFPSMWCFFQSVMDRVKLHRFDVISSEE